MKLPSTQTANAILNNPAMCNINLNMRKSAPCMDRITYKVLKNLPKRAIEINISKYNHIYAGGDIPIE